MSAEPRGSGARESEPRGGEGLPHQLRVMARGGTLNLVGGSLNAVFQLLLIVILTRTLGAHDAGVFFEAVALFTIVTIAAQLGAETGLVRTIPPLLAAHRPHEIPPVISIAVWPVALVTTIIAVTMVGFAPELVRVFMHGVPEQEGARYIRLLAPFGPLATVSLVLLAATRGFGTMVPSVLVEQVGKPAARIVVVVIALSAGASLWGVMVAWAVPVGVGFLVALALVRKLLTPTSRGGQPASPIAGDAVAFWRFSLPRGLAGIFEVTLGWLDILLVGAFLPPAEVAVYAAASRIAAIALVALRASGTAIAPQLSELLGTGRRREAEGLYQVATEWLIALSWPVYLTLAVFASQVLLTFGPSFEEGGPALVILSVAMLVNMATGNVNAVLLMAGKSSWNLANATVALVLNVVLNLILIPRIGIEGAAIAWAASIVVQNLAGVFQLRVLGFDPFGRGYALVCGAAALCFGVTGWLVGHRLLEPSWPSLIVSLILSCGLYVTILFLARKTLHLGAIREALGRRPHPGLPHAIRSS